ncbi:MAG: T9SS type A sorting domain-containing protein, partial [Ignavibacteria bacterium]|nr:T9SS type A sorting domain-containing protein [Ignavibacteria bacterium]
AEQWVARYNGTVNGNDGANSIAIDNLGNIIVSGYTTTNGNSNDFATIKYNSAGITQWLRTYNGLANQNDSSVAIAVDANNNICVTGFSTGTGTAKDFTTIKYNPDGFQDWLMRFNSVNNGEDISNSIVIDLNGDVYVTGKSPTEESNDDILTLKYSSITGIEQTFTGNVNQYILYNNYPNPFNPSTQISFNIPKESFVKLKIYDISGKEVQTLVNSVLEPGYHKVSFSPINSSSNIYFYRLETDQFVQTKKMIFIK